MLAMTVCMPLPVSLSARLLRRLCGRISGIGGKEIAGDGTPEGLPLIFRFFHPCLPAVQLLINQRRLAPSRRWRTLFLVTPRSAGPCAALSQRILTFHLLVVDR